MKGITFERSGLELSVMTQARTDYQEIQPRWLTSPGKDRTKMVVRLEDREIPVSITRMTRMTRFSREIWEARQKFRNYVELRIQEEGDEALRLAVDNALACLVNDLANEFHPSGRRHFVVTADRHGAVVEEVSGLGEEGFIAPDALRYM